MTSNDNDKLSGTDATIFVLLILMLAIIFGLLAYTNYGNGGSILESNNHVEVLSEQQDRQ